MIIVLQMINVIICTSFILILWEKKLKFYTTSTLLSIAIAVTVGHGRQTAFYGRNMEVDSRAAKSS